jgi:hypothetical protein
MARTDRGRERARWEQSSEAPCLLLTTEGRRRATAFLFFPSRAWQSAAEPTEGGRRGASAPSRIHSQPPVPACPARPDKLCHPHQRNGGLRPFRSGGHQRGGTKDGRGGAAAREKTRIA